MNGANHLISPCLTCSGKGVRFRLHVQRTLIKAVSILFLLSLQGCAHKTIDEPITAPGKIALLIRNPAENSQLDISGSSTLAAMGRGAASGSVLGGLGAVCYWSAIVCIPVLATVGAIGGATAGAAKATPQSVWTDAEMVMRAALNSLEVDKKLEEETLAYVQSLGRDLYVPVSRTHPISNETLSYEELSRRGFESAVEINDISIHLVPINLEVAPPYELNVSASFRLISLKDLSVLDEQLITSATNYFIDGMINSSESLGKFRARPIESWMDEDAKLFREAVSVALQKLAKNIAAELFVLRFSSRTIPLSSWNAIDLYGLEPYYPSLRPDQAPEVNSLEPTMSWKKLDADNVTYDLCIWRYGQVVYYRERLFDTSHTVDTPLEPSTHYDWSVRARIMKDGKETITQWSRYRKKINTTLTNPFTILGVTLGVALVEWTVDFSGAPLAYYEFMTPSTSNKR